MSTSCPICFEDYKGKKTVKITCQYCPEGACKGCQQRYLLQTYEDPHCMHCKRGWTEDFMAANFPLVFRNDTLRKHRRKILFEREKSLLPSMQAFVELKKELQGLEEMRKELEKDFTSPDPDADTIYKRFRLADNTYYSVQRLLGEARARVAEIKTQRLILEGRTDPASVRAMEELERVLAKARAERAKLKTQETATIKAREIAAKEYRDRSKLLSDNNTLHYQVKAAYDGNGIVVGDAKRVRREFIMKCCADDCRGFLSSAYKCGTCEKWTCPDCLVVLGLDKHVEHTCKKEEVESAKAIKAETRPCPKCGARIFKIDGCDQMWCTVEGCGTAFSWNTGQIAVGRVHNPHYYEWLRRNGGGTAPREAGDIPCGGLPDYWQLNNAFRTGRIYVNYTQPSPAVKAIDVIHRNVTELIAMRLPAHPATQGQLANKEHDVKYLMNEYSEDEWKRQLEIAEARFIRKKEIGQILQMAATAASDMFTALITRLNVTPSYQSRDETVNYMTNTFVPELEQLRAYVNESLQALGKRNHMAVPQLADQWAWKPARILYKAVKAKKAKDRAVAEEAVADDIPELIEDDPNTVA